ncbi:MAG: prepilin peptidase [Oribacterium sp.]|nr:prepilin peptidase [Oribacterium sp.]
MFLTIYISTIAFILGAVFGSFTDCMAYRIMNGESVLKGRSHCDVCGHVLGARDLVPIFSWLFSHGKCRYCDARISAESTITELLMGICFVITVTRFGLSFEALRILVLLVIFFALSIIDLHTLEIPDRFHIAILITYFITLPLVAWQKTTGYSRVSLWTLMTVQNSMNIESQTAGSTTFTETLLHMLLPGLLTAALIGGGMLLISLIMDKVLGKESMGGGDIKLFFATGFYLTPLLGLFNLVLCCLIGLVFVFAFKKQKIPFGPSICIGTFISLLFGNQFINWYISLF